MNIYIWNLLYTISYSSYNQNEEIRHILLYIYIYYGTQYHICEFPETEAIMSLISFNNPVKVHFIGIGGISMSGFAELLKNKGFDVTGSDARKSNITCRLEAMGITVKYGNRASNIEPDTKLVIYTAAVKEDNPELMAAKELGIPAVTRADMVGDIMLEYRNNYSVSGTHGKTTTTSMLALIFMEAGQDPTVSVGGILENLGGNMRIGSNENMIIESCEYTDSFLSFHPTHAIITNIEAEHLDYFGTLENERNSFRRFAELLPGRGLLVINGEIPDYKTLFSDVKCPVITYGINTDDDYTAADISYNEFGFGCFTLVRNKRLQNGDIESESLGRIQLSVPGEHNVSNATGIAALSLESGISFNHIAAALSKYKGTERRFEKKGVIGGVTIIDDYAHHPTEMTATLRAAANYPHKTIWCVFQPHTYSRTIAFRDEICEALSLSDEIILTDIYAAREENPGTISSSDLVEILRDKFGKKAYHFCSFDEIETFLLEKCCDGDLLITMGAGDVVSIGESLLGK